jgi:hypothetical protein
VPREQHENSKASFCWFDPRQGRFVLHMEENSRLKFSFSL